MKRVLLLAIIAGLFAFVPQKKAKVIFFGDSITQAGAQPGGYITRIDSMSRLERLNDRYEFAGAGVGGNKIYDLYLRMDDDVLAKSPDIVLIYVGVNDVWHKSMFGTGTDPDKFEKFYQAVINKIKAKGSKIIMATPAAIGEKTDFSNVQDGDLNKYCNIIRDIAKKNGIPVVDLRKGLLDYNLQHNPDNKDKGILTTDGVHLNPAGNQFVADAMWKVIKELK
jgi:lysophospholipase L1-like esterase